MEKNKFQYLPFLAAALLFLYIDPYFMWKIHNGTHLYEIFNLFLLFIFVKYIDIRNRVGLFILFILILLYVPFSQGKNHNVYILTMSLCAIPFINKNKAIITYDYFLTIYSVIISISGIVWLLSLVGLIPSMGMIEPLNKLKSYNYIEYPFLVVTNSSAYYRFNGPFDEPGVVGTMNILILTISKYNLRDKRLWPILITGFFSFSFFFYAMILVYYLFVPLVKKNSKKSFLITFVIIALIILTYNNAFFHDMIWSRFEWDDSNGKLAGDNRVTDAAWLLFYSTFMTKEFFWGVNNYSLYEADFYSYASIVLPLLKYGVVFVGSYILFFVWYGYTNKKRLIDYVLFLLVFVGTIYQRPFLTEPEFIFCFSLMAANIISNEDSNVNIQTRQFHVQKHKSNIFH